MADCVNSSPLLTCKGLRTVPFNPYECAGSLFRNGANANKDRRAGISEDMPDAPAWYLAPGDPGLTAFDAVNRRQHPQRGSLRVVGSLRALTL